MAYGSILGATAYVCMFVVGIVLCAPPHGPLKANTALVRDIISLVAVLLLLLLVFVKGLTMASVVLMAVFYALLTGASLGYTQRSSARRYSCCLQIEARCKNRVQPNLERNLHGI
jgi:Ca2+/Na+ antiporter